MQGAPVTAEFWQEYQGTQLWHFPGSAAYFYLTERMAIDADGAPNAYHPEDQGIDALANAGYPDGGVAIGPGRRPERRLAAVRPAER
jgi:hypothetical protein